MSALTTIYADARWELLSSMSNKSSTFYGDKNVMGGNGTAWSSSKTSEDMAMIDKERQEGYLTRVMGQKVCGQSQSRLHGVDPRSFSQASPSPHLCGPGDAPVS